MKYIYIILGVSSITLGLIDIIFKLGGLGIFSVILGAVCFLPLIEK